MLSTIISQVGRYVYLVNNTHGPLSRSHENGTRDGAPMGSDSCSCLCLRAKDHRRCYSLQDPVKQRFPFLGM